MKKTVIHSIFHILNFESMGSVGNFQASRQAG